ncbi:hypothetical protein [Lentiprolixibacter aurantiacus]|uniref:DinB family protein n=1 Tax=Lentiprolixibacter aurantiacus TaxID=2993939 RepID=A0AAE3MMA7_9FLAO|nr:hypothetical protein [Lentiprolixibacter aurantiacus]MCX2720063.1 hypothetical protein [Lentiprolixibacter aurantiacus]
MKYLLTVLCLISLVVMNAQNKDNEELPYYEIPDYPESYSAGTVVSRMIDGLGFRYYWATENLRETDLAYRPGKDSRSADETLDHILGLSRVILNSALQKPNDGSQSGEETLSFTEKRSQTLNNLRKASLVFLEADHLEEHPVIFRNADRETAFPFWNQINGPIADALWHCGQIVSLRRQSGNPFPKGVSVFLGNRQN